MNSTPAPSEGLAEALRALMRGYVNLLRTGRDRILDYGGACDSLEVMERQDPHLRAAASALSAQALPPAGQAEEGDARIARQAILMIRASDLVHWTDAHDRVVLDALAGYFARPAVQVDAGWRLLKDTTHAERSKPGEYSCTCCHCLRTFTSHKRDVSCAACDTPAAPKGTP